MATPFAVISAPPPATDLPDHDNRARSIRVFAVVLALLGTALAFAVGAVVLIYVGQEAMRWEPLSNGIADVATMDEPEPDDVEDGWDPGAFVPDEPQPAPIGRPRPEVEQAPAPPARGSVTVHVPTDARYTHVEITDCGGERFREPFVGATAVIANVPTDRDCKLVFKGGEPAQFRPVRGDSTLDCTFVSTTALCKQGPTVR